MIWCQCQCHPDESVTKSELEINGNAISATGTDCSLMGFSIYDGWVNIKVWSSDSYLQERKSWSILIDPWAGILTLPFLNTIIFWLNQTSSTPLFTSRNMHLLEFSMRRSSWPVSYTACSWGQRRFLLLFFFSHHLEIISQSIKPTVQRLRIFYRYQIQFLFVKYNQNSAYITGDGIVQYLQIS